MRTINVNIVVDDSGIELASDQYVVNQLLIAVGDMGLAERIHDIQICKSITVRATGIEL